VQLFSLHPRARCVREEDRETYARSLAVLLVQ
jgi:hypothetical protein